MNMINIEAQIWAKKVAQWEREHDQEVVFAITKLRDFTARDYFEEVSAMGFQPCAIASRTRPLRFVERPPPIDKLYDRDRYRLLQRWACGHREHIRAEIIRRGAIYVKTRRGPWESRLRHIGMNWPAAKRIRLPSF